MKHLATYERLTAVRLIAIPNEALAPDQARHVVAFLMQRGGGD